MNQQIVLARWAWGASKSISTDAKLRTKFTLAALRNPEAASALARPDALLARQLADDPQTVGNLVWPYQCATWDAAERVTRIRAHFEVVQKVPGLQLTIDQKLMLADLSELSEGLSLIIDRPLWLAREGHLALSLFKGRFRAFTVSFSLNDTSVREIFIGGIQGRNAEGILDIYRDLTKSLHGVRPRDFLLDGLRMFGELIGVQRILAVSDSSRISRHSYFKGKVSDSDYDVVWTDRGGTLEADTHYSLPTAIVRRTADETPAKKRQMYRKRYEMFDKIADSLPRDLRAAKIVRFEAG